MKKQVKRVSAVINQKAFDLCFDAIVQAGKQARMYEQRTQDAFTESEVEYAKENYAQALDRCQKAIEDLVKFDRQCI